MFILVLEYLYITHSKDLYTQRRSLRRPTCIWC